MVSPMASRWSMNQSKSSGGSITSATAVIGNPSAARKAPPHSQLPTWGSAMTTPRPSAIAALRCS